MHTVDRLLLQLFLRNLARSLAVACVVMLAYRAVDLGDVLGSLSLPVAGILLLAAFDGALPLALLLATLFTVAPLARYQELTALRVAGQSMERIMAPLLAVGFAVTLLAVGLRWAGLVRLLADPATPAAVATMSHAGRAAPLFNMVAVLLGIALAATTRRAAVFEGFGRALLLLLGFHVVNATALSLGRAGVLIPAIAGWLGVAVALAASALTYRRVR